MKLDMSKAYDRVEWSFLGAVMRRMGFPDRFIDLILRCVSTVKFFFLVNREVYGEVVPSRGLRQGDPLSPFLFVICAQGLSTLIHKAERDGRMEGLPLVAGRIHISYLFFADDSVVFMKANTQGAMAMKELLVLYENASGQMVNKDKSTLTFSPNTRETVVKEVKDILCIRRDQGMQMYLGLPTFSLRQKGYNLGTSRIGYKRSLWGGIIEIFRQGGQEVLLKAVIQAIPTYAMQCFKLPDSICDDISRMCAAFWWGDKEDKRKIHWTKWEKMCIPKCNGGGGFRDLRKFNKALLAKQLWRLIVNPDLLVARVFEEKYCRRKEVMEMTSRPGCSYVWRSILRSKDAVEKGIKWRVGTGDAVRVFRDRWVHGMVVDKLKGVEGKRDDRLKVASFIGESGTWNVATVKELFHAYECQTILETEIQSGG